MYRSKENGIMNPHVPITQLQTGISLEPVRSHLSPNANTHLFFTFPPGIVLKQMADVISFYS